MTRSLAALLLLLALLTPSFAGDDEDLICPRCDRGFPAAPRFCPDDGNRLVRRAFPHRSCPRCGLLYHHGERFCPVDGLELVNAAPKARSCAECGRRYLNNEQFCPFDGHALGPPVTPAPPAEPAPTPAPAPTPTKPKDEVLPAPAPRDPPRGAAAAAQLTRRESREFVARERKTSRLDFKASAAGVMTATARYEGGGKVRLLIYAPGRKSPLAQASGLSPVSVEAVLDSESVRLDKSFELWIVHEEGAEAIGDVSFELPVSGFPLPEPAPTPAPAEPRSSEPAAPEDGAPKAEAGRLRFELAPGGAWTYDMKDVKAGRLGVDVAFSGDESLMIVLSTADGRQLLARKEGASPLKLYYQVPEDGAAFRLLLVSFGAETIQGSVALEEP